MKTRKKVRSLQATLPLPSARPRSRFQSVFRRLRPDTILWNGWKSVPSDSQICSESIDKVPLPEVSEECPTSCLDARLQFPFQEGFYGCFPASWADSQVISFVRQGLVAPLALLDWALLEVLQLLYQEPSCVVVHQTLVFSFDGL